jgi:hypothetical protein
MKTSRLSLATALALGLTASSLSAANTDLIDIPLTESQWKFIGVKSGFSETASSGSVFDESIYTVSEIEIIDDNLSTEVHGSNADGNLTVSFWVIDHNSEMEYTSAKMFVQDRKSDSTNMLNEMYVYSDENNATPSIRIRYQGQYETDKFYLQLSGSANVYEGTFESQAEYDNPQKLTQLSGAGMATEENLSIEYVWDLNLSNNPGKSGVAGTKNDYTFINHHDTINKRTTNVDENISIYHYDAHNTSWTSCITGDSDTHYKLNTSSCDFQEFEPGKGYWVKASHKATDSGLILGSGTLTYSDYTLTNGWNMLSMNDYDIAPKGGTGLFVDINHSGIHEGPVTFIITDSEGTVSMELNSSPLYYAKSDSNVSRMIQLWNRQIGTYIADGNLSDTFNVRIYPTSTSTRLFIASDSKFIIKEKSENLDFLSDVNTTGNNNPLSLSTGGRSVVTNLDNIGVSSVFGETALGLVRIDDGVAENTLDYNITFNKSGSTAVGKMFYSTDITDDADANNIYISNAVTIDTDFDGTMDTIIVADENGTNFSVQDYSFTKKYKFLPSGFGGLSGEELILDLEQNLSADVNATIKAGDTTLEAIAHKIDRSHPDINATSYAKDGYIYVITSNPDYKNFSVGQEDGNLSLLKLVSGEGDDNASGMVREVYTLANLGQAEINRDSKYTLRLGQRTMSSAISKALDNSYYYEFNISNFYSMPKLNPLGEITPAYARVRFGYFDEMNTSSRLSANAEYYMNVKGTTIGVDYAAGNDNSTDVNFSIYPSNLDSNSSSTAARWSYAEFWAEAINRHFTDYNQSFNINASFTDNNLTLIGDFNLTITGSDENLTIFDTNTSAIVYESNLTIPTKIPNLTYEKVYASTMNSEAENPLSVIQRAVDADGNNYKITKILSTNEHKDAISWNFIDLTKYNTGWFDDNDPYNIFSFHGEKGYWVFLDGGYTNPLSGLSSGEDTTANGGLASTDITSAVFKYNHEFTGDVNSTASSPNDETINWKKGYTMTTTNTLYDGTVVVDVSNMVDASKVDRAVLTIDGESVPMIQSGNEYTATFSEYELEDFGTDATLDVNISFFTSDYFSKTIGLILDNEAPTRPSFTINDVYLTDVTFTSSADTIYFHVYEGDINDSNPLSTAVNTANTLVDSNILADGAGVATGYNFCATVQEFNDNLGNYQFIAVDGTTNSGYVDGSPYYGDIQYNRVSNVGYIPDSNNSYAIYKNASIYQVPAGATDRIPVLYGSDCKTDSVTQLVNDDYGVSATSLNGAEFNMSIETNSSVPALAETGVGSISDVQIAVDNNIIGRIQFNSGGDYYSNHNQPVLIAYNGSIYKTDFAILESNSTLRSGVAGSQGIINLSDANKTLLTGQSILGSD